MKASKIEAKPAETPKKQLGKTLVAYVTKSAAAGEAANLIADTLREKSGLEVELVDLKMQPHPDLEPYANVILGSGARMGSVYREAVEFMKQDLSSKRVAIFICSVAGGDPRRTDLIADRYITEGLARNPNLRLVSMKAFGGCLKALGKPVLDRRDPARIQAWAEELGKKLAE
jgi:menaquinone-dependent protoporphyrinogen IX oxidase